MPDKKIDLLNTYTNEDLKIMQSWSLERKIMVTQTRIIEWYIKHNGNVYVSFSGGKDSTVLLDLARRIYPNILAVYVDTGLEYPEVKEFVKTKENIKWLKPKMNFRKVIEKYGYPIISKEQAQYISEYKTTKSEKLKNIRLNGNKYGMGKISKKWRYLIDADFNVTHKCCLIMKKNPSKEFEKKYNLHPIIATMACESKNRETAWKRHGCNSFEGKRPISQPLSFWTEQDILEYIYRFKIPYASVYGDIKKNYNGEIYTTGCDRTGCIFCGFGCHLEKEPNRFQRLKQTHPKLWEYCMKPWDEGGLDMQRILEYINVEIE